MTAVVVKFLFENNLKRKIDEIDINSTLKEVETKKCDEELKDVVADAPQTKKIRSDAEPEMGPEVSASV